MNGSNPTDNAPLGYIEVFSNEEILYPLTWITSNPWGKFYDHRTTGKHDRFPVWAEGSRYFVPIWTTTKVGKVFYKRME